MSLCSTQTQATGVCPTGSALLRTSFLLVEVPLPWPRDLRDHDALGPVHAAIDEAANRDDPWRIQAIAPRPGADPERRRLVAHPLQVGRSGLARYERFELEVAAGDVVQTAADLIAAPGGSGAVRTDGVVDLLVCTHGRRDRCCGSFGTALWNAVRTLDTPSVRLERTSHLGGHRFAPTALLLPSGTMWAWLGPSQITDLVAERGPVPLLAEHYRGSCALGSPAEQVVDRAVFEKVGWNWMHSERRGNVTPTEDAGSSSVQLDYRSPQGRAGTWHAVVEQVGSSVVPTCGEESQHSTSSHPVLAVLEGSLRHVPANPPGSEASAPASERGLRH